MKVGFFDIDKPSRALDPRLGVRFSEEEMKSLAIAVSALTVAFTVVFSGGLFTLLGNLGKTQSLIDFGLNLVVSFFAVLTAFVLHEIGHKIVANHYGYPAAFSYSKNGLIMAVVISLLLGFLVAAPGAVLIYGYPDKKENGIISAAGPLTNLLVAGAAFGLFVAALILSPIVGSSGFVFALLTTLIIINVIIGAFNMIPIGILDGAKILRWNKPVYFIMVSLYVPGILLFFVAPNFIF
jgi:Zn-dependent protease